MISCYDFVTEECPFFVQPMLSLQKLVLVVFSFLTGLLGLASVTGLTVSAIRIMIYKGTKILETHCKTTTSDVDSSSITYECPFDPTRLYVSAVFFTSLQQV